MAADKLFGTSIVEAVVFSVSACGPGLIMGSAIKTSENQNAPLIMNHIVLPFFLPVPAVIAARFLPLRSVFALNLNVNLPATEKKPLSQNAKI